MTRKKYIHNIQNLILAIHNHPSSDYPEGTKVGESLKYAKDHAKEVPKTFGSYEKAWNNDAVTWARKYYGVN